MDIRCVNKYENFVQYAQILHSEQMQKTQNLNSRFVLGFFLKVGFKYKSCFII